MKELSAERMWELVIAIERAAWARKWGALKRARRELEKATASKRPHAIIDLEVEGEPGKTGSND